MEYRTTQPQENGFGDEAEEFAGMRHFIQHMMAKSAPGDLLDSVLVVVNICEQRALMTTPHQRQSEWYKKTALFLRSALDMLAPDTEGPRPQQKMENPLLYLPDVPIFH